VRFGTWNIRSPYRSELFTTVARGSAMYTFDLMSVQGGTRGTVRGGIIFFSVEKEMKIISWEQDFSYTTE